MRSFMELGVNIDHVATLRQARKGIEPDPVFAALIAVSSGADSIVAHLREDRRHIQEKDLFLLKELIKVKLNLEMSIAEEIVSIASRVRPDQATLVPEKRQELTTEGGLDVSLHLKKIKEAVKKLNRRGIAVSLFIDPQKKQIDAAVRSGVKMVELHTGCYADSRNKKEQEKFFKQIQTSALYARRKGLRVFAGHGLNYSNAGRIASIKSIEELNIGHSIVSRAVTVGLGKAVEEMKALINQR